MCFSPENQTGERENAFGLAEQGRQPAAAGCGGLLFACRSRAALCRLRAGRAFSGAKRTAAGRGRLPCERAGGGGVRPAGGRGRVEPEARAAIHV
ncbi:MAG: hypothetical protein LBH06_01590 [Rikenellaceae bacterium]|nr:hypothetical protein [Rikenellaceae bacterium]